jgi:serine/threonine-protein kinase
LTNRRDLDRWRALVPHLDQALDLTPEERIRWLAALRAQDAELAEELGRLLQKYDALDPRFLSEGADALLPAASLAGYVLGAYTLRSQIGQGGMGSVWQAERSDGRYQGTVAVKLLNPGLVGREGETRFRREASILARLRHPHIAHLIDAGVSSFGHPYLVLERVEGEHIDAYCDARRLDVWARVRLFVDVLHAVAHAHANLVVHRDIKPSNVLVDAAGRVKLLDFGIAKLLESEEGAETVTRDGAAALTPEYAAPEQLTGGTITTATDVYALGVLIYILLAGRHPASRGGESPADLMRSIVDTEPQRLSDAVSDTRTSTREALAEVAARRASTPERLRRLLRGDLETIVVKALKKKPEERYGSVADLADDLRRYLEHQPIRARPDTLAYRAAKFVRRHRPPVALGALLAAAVVAGTTGTFVQGRRAERQAATAAEQRDFALRQLTRAEAINDLNAFLLHEAAPGEEPLSVRDLLARAEEVVGRQREDPDGTQMAMMVEIARLYELRGEQERSRALLTRAWDLAARSDDPTSRARTACALATVLGRIGEGERASELFLRVERELPQTPQFALPWVDCVLGRSELGDASHGIREAERAKRLLEASGFRSSPLQLRVELRLADAYRLVGRSHEADLAYASAYERLVALGRERTQLASRLLADWALMAARGLGQPLRAERMFRQALDLAGAGSDGQGAHPGMLHNLSRALSDLDRHREALDYAELAHRGAVENGDTTTTLQSQLTIAALRRRLGDLTSAQRALAELEPTMRRLLGPKNLRLSMLEMEKAQLALARGDTANALPLADGAVAMAEAGQGEQPQYLRRLLLRRSEIRWRLGRLAEAAADAERCLRLELEANEPGVPSSHVGAAYLALGRALESQQKSGEAGAAFAAAAAQLEPTLGAEHPDCLEARRRGNELPAPEASRRPASVAPHSRS